MFRMRNMEPIVQLPPRTAARIADRAPDSCANCRFFLVHGPANGINPRNLQEPARGMCRRYPPTAAVIGMQPNPIDPKMGPLPVSGRAITIVGGVEWCGEHERDE